MEIELSGAMWLDSLKRVKLNFVWPVITLTMPWATYRKLQPALKFFVCFISLLQLVISPRALIRDRGESNLIFVTLWPLLM